MAKREIEIREEKNNKGPLAQKKVIINYLYGIKTYIL